MYSLNRAEVIGYVTETPELRQLPSGVAVTDLNVEIKVHIPQRDNGQNTSTTFMTATLWRRMAEIAGQYVKKGTQVYLSGRLETDSWEDDSGNKRYKTKMVADDMILLSPKDGGHAPLPESISLFGGVNKIEVIGNLTKDPELKSTPSGSMVSSFGVATSRQWKNQATDEMQEKTEFHNIVVWDDLAEIVSKHLVKGRKVYVTGRIQNRSWEGPDGQKRYTTEIVATEIKSLGHAQDGDSAAPVADESSYSEAPAASVNNDVPEVNYESEIKPEDLPF